MYVYDVLIYLALMSFLFPKIHVDGWKVPKVKESLCLTKYFVWESIRSSSKYLCIFLCVFVCVFVCVVCIIIFKQGHLCVCVCVCVNEVVPETLDLNSNGRNIMPLNPQIIHADL